MTNTEYDREKAGEDAERKARAFDWLAAHPTWRQTHWFHNPTSLLEAVENAASLAHGIDEFLERDKE